MVDISLTSNIDEVLRGFTTLTDNLKSKATVQALNRTAENVVTVAVKDIAQLTGLKQATVRKALKIKRASANNINASVDASGRTDWNVVEWIPGAQVSTTQFRQSRTTRGGRRVGPPSGVKSKAYGRSQVHPGSFIIHGRNSGKLIVAHKDSRTPSGVKGTYGPSIPRSFLSERIEAVMRGVVDERFPINLRAAATFLNRR